MHQPFVNVYVKEYVMEIIITTKETMKKLNKIVRVRVRLGC